jgi:hypothetical protein
MESNPFAGLLGFWMMLQLFATLALLGGGIYLLFCLGRAASGLDRMANAMEDWVALQNQNLQNQSRPSSAAGSTPGAGAPPIPVALPSNAPTSATPFTPAALPTQPEYSPPKMNTSEMNTSDEKQL